WSPDSSHVAAATLVSGQQLLVVDARTATVTQVTHDADPDQRIFDLQWSPSSNQILFQRETIPLGGPWTNDDIVVACADGSCLHPLARQLSPAQGQVGQASWASDG